MSKKMTPCEKLGYKVGDKFEVLTDGDGFEIGSIVELWRDDDSICPLFRGKGCDGEYLEIYLNACQPENVVVVLDVKKVDETKKLKPAKQALADAIHQNGGWRGGCYAVFGKVGGRCIFCDEKPYFSRDANCWYVHADKVVGAFSMKPFVNWHQCILSRDAYFTAYPDQVKVEVNNETKHKVEVEMKSESEATINASDWHKKGELPPVGEVCLWIGRKENGDYRADLRTGDRVEVIAHYKPRSDGPMVAVFAYESRESIGRQTDQSIAKCFSPLRNEREKAIDEMVSLVEPLAANREFAGTIYDAGMYKEVK